MDASDADTPLQTSSADQQPQVSQPQRSRTTFVCGECKRLKLRCDRQQPCASCLKRNTIPKCLYSAAAVEKLDVHSLNNRLTHIESFTTTYTNGRFQPAYASANHPPSQVVHTHVPNYAYQSNQGGFYHQHHHHAGVLNYNTTAETFADSFQSLISTCLGELGIVQDPTSSSQADIKLEPSANGIAVFEGRSGTFPNARRMSKSQLKQLLGEHRTQAHTMLPSISVYFSATPNLVSIVPPKNGVPQVSPGLLSYLPPLATCQRLLQSAGVSFRFRPIPFDPSYGFDQGWKGLERRCLQFLNNSGKNREEKRPRAVAKRARDIYLAGPSQPLLNDSGAGYMANPPNEEDGGHHSSLTFFAMTCAALAIGTVSSPNEDEDALMPSSGAFFYALSQQALGIWDTHVSSSSSKPSTTKGDTEQMEYLLACLLNIVYLLQSGTVAAASVDKAGDGVQDEDMETCDELQDDDSQIVTSLVGKMIAVARNMHLNKETTWSKRKKKSHNRDPLRDEWKRMIWWEIVFYDLFIADAIGQQPHISPGSYNTNFPSCAIFSSVLKSEEVKTISEDGLLHGTDQDRRLRDQLITSGTRDEEAYFGARYQLARVAQAVKSRNSLPDCCCGYTLDQAVALENQIREWQDCLPAFLKISEDEETTAVPIPSTLEGTLTRLQAYELAIMASVLVINVYMPFLIMNGDDGVMSRFRNLPAASACIHAAQAIVHLADGLQSVLSDPSISSLSPANVMPVMFQFIPLEKLVFDAVVVCTHTAFAGKSPSMAFSMSMMADDASLGLKVLRKFGTSLPTMIDCDGDDEFQKKVVNTLHARLVQRSTRLKRKLDEEITDGDPHDFFQSVSGGPATSRQTHQISQQDPPTLHHTFIMDSLSSQSTLESDYSGSQSPSHSNRQAKSSNKEKGKKGRKGVKKHPPIGLRLRDASSAHLAPRSHPSPLAKAEDLWNSEQNLPGSVSASSPLTDTQTMPTISPIAASFTATGHRSRSSSTSRVHSQTVDSSLSFGTPLAHSSDEMGMPLRKRPVLQDIREQQLQPQPMRFLSHTFDQGNRQTQQGIEYNQIMLPTTFDGQCPTAGPMDQATYRVASSTQSPYMNNDPVPEHTTPTYDPLTSIGPTSYFSSSTSYGSAYVEQFPSSNVSLHNSAPTTVVDSQPPMTTVSNTSVYEHSQQQPTENYLSHSQTHHMQNHPYHGHLVSDEPLLVSMTPGWVTPSSQKYWDGRPS